MAIGVNCTCIEGLVPRVHAVKTAVSPVVSLCMQCVMRACVVNGTRKTLPRTMWLCSEEHMFTKEVEYIICCGYPRRINEHASICMHIYILYMGTLNLPRYLSLCL